MPQTQSTMPNCWPDCSDGQAAEGPACERCERPDCPIVMPGLAYTGILATRPEPVQWQASHLWGWVAAGAAVALLLIGLHGGIKAVWPW